MRSLLFEADESASDFFIHKSQQGVRSHEILDIVDNDTRKHGLRSTQEFDSIMAFIETKLPVEEDMRILIKRLVPEYKYDTEGI